MLNSVVIGAARWALPFLIAIAAYLWWRVATSKAFELRVEYSFLAVTATLFFIGTDIKYALLGPDWLRFYMSHLGLPALIMMTLWGLVGPIVKRQKSEFMTLNERIARLQIRLVALAGSFIVACILKLLTVTIRFARLSRGLWSPFGVFDWVDVFCYGVSVGIGCAILAYLMSRTHKQSVEALQTEVATADKTE